MTAREARLTCELLPHDRVVELWPQLAPLYQASFDSCEISAGVGHADDILEMSNNNECFVFGFFADEELQLTLALQFAFEPRRKIANILGMGGNNMRIFFHHYWPYILDWLRTNGVVSLYTETNDRNAKIYMKKLMEPYGPSKSAVKLGLDL